MQKVLVIGCPGTGKTKLSTQLAAKTGLPLIHLDSFYHQKDKNYESDKLAWRKKVQEILKADKWIIGGNFVSTLDLRIPSADTIIYLDYPRYRCLWQVVKRRIEYRKKPRPDMPETWKETADRSFIKYIWKFKNENTPTINNILVQNRDKRVLTFTSPTQTKIFLTKNT